MSLVLLEELARPLLVQEEAVDALDVLDRDGLALALPTHQAGHGDQLNRVPEVKWIGRPSYTRSLSRFVI